MTKPDQTWIEKTMKALSISEEEALDLWACDHDEDTDEEQEALDKKARAVKIDHGAEAKEKKKRAPRERKVDEEKGHLLSIISASLEGAGVSVESVKTETEIAFTFNGNSYTVKLTKHRPPKN